MVTTERENTVGGVFVGDGNTIIIHKTVDQFITGNRFFNFQMVLNHVHQLGVQFHGRAENIQVVTQGIKQVPGIAGVMGSEATFFVNAGHGAGHEAVVLADVIATAQTHKASFANIFRAFIMNSQSIGTNIDQDLMFTLLDMDMEEEISQRALAYVNNYPDNELSPYFRSVRLANLDQMTESQALMDSTMAAWRSHEMYHASPKSRSNVDLAGKRYEAYMADLADQPSTRIRKWNSVLNGLGEFVPLHNQRSARIKLARAYMDNSEPLKAQEQIRPILEANNRLVPALILAVRSDLALGKAQQARLALEQLKWSIQQSDDNFYARKTVELLEERVIDLEGNP